MTKHNLTNFLSDPIVRPFNLSTHYASNICPSRQLNISLE